MSIQKYVADEVVNYLKERDDLTQLLCLLETKHGGEIHKCINVGKEGCEGWYYSINSNNHSWHQVSRGYYKIQDEEFVYYCKPCGRHLVIRVP